MNGKDELFPPVANEVKGDPLQHIRNAFAPHQNETTTGCEDMLWARRQLLLQEQRGELLLQSQTVGGRRKSEQMEVRFFHFLIDHGWPRQHNLPNECLEECIRCVAGGQYKKASAFRFACGA